VNLRSAYLTTEQAAQQLGISRRTLGRAVDRGEIAWDRQTPGGWALLLATDVAAFAQLCWPFATSVGQTAQHDRRASPRCSHPKMRSPETIARVARPPGSVLLL